MKMFRLLLLAGMCTAPWLTGTVLHAADPSGTWTWTRQNRNGETVEVTARLQYADGKLTGTISGFQGRETAIAAGKFEGDQVSFNVVIEFGGRQFTITYSGKLAGDIITGTVTRPDRSGGQVTSEWEATRETG